MTKSQIISTYAQASILKIVSRIIRQLQKQKITLSDVHSGLENTWEEICVQIQDEFSFHWDVYEEILLNHIKEEVGKMARHEQQAIWLETEFAYTYDEDEDDLEVMDDPFAVYHHIKSIIFKKAGDRSNKRIRKNIDRG